MLFRKEAPAQDGPNPLVSAEQRLIVSERADPDLYMSRV